MHKDKAELERIKREVAKSTVEKAVNECTRLTNIYDKKKEELERQHEEVRQKLEEERAKVCISLHKVLTFRIYGCNFIFLVLFSNAMFPRILFDTRFFYLIFTSVSLTFPIVVYFFSTSVQEDTLTDTVPEK